MTLQVEQLTRLYNGRVIFKDISFQVEAGETLVVMGPNGSGKSTLLKIISGLLKPSAGAIRLRLNGKELDPGRRKSCTGYASPEVNLYDRLTAYENLSFFAVLRGFPACYDRIPELLDRLHLKDFMHQPLGQYSSGMKQRVKLACALLHDPYVLMLDEPSTNLDERGKRVLEDLVKQGSERRITLIATNEPEEVKIFGQKRLELGRPPGGAA